MFMFMYMICTIAQKYQLPLLGMPTIKSKPACFDIVTGGRWHWVSSDKGGAKVEHISNGNDDYGDAGQWGMMVVGIKSALTREQSRCQWVPRLKHSFCQIFFTPQTFTIPPSM